MTRPGREKGRKVIANYFESAYSHLRGLKPNGALRKAQRLALRAVSAHVGQRQDPTIVVLPTGAGKTAILVLTPSAQRAQNPNGVSTSASSAPRRMEVRITVPDEFARNSKRWPTR